MNRQISYSNKNSLYLVGTPIGNLEDVTYRAINILKDADIIYAEDTRVTRVLLNHYGIKTKLSCYQEQKKEIQGKNILDDLKNGLNVCLVSDAGMPIISDPGYDIVNKCIMEGFNVIAIPGPSAFLCGLITSGFNPHPFIFCGFISSKSSGRKKFLEEYKDFRETLVFYEAPHRIKEFLEDCLLILGNRNISLAREITKKFEEIIRGTIEEVITIIPEIKGEMVITIEGNKLEKDFSNLSIIEHVNLYIKEGYTAMDSIKAVAKERNIKKQDVYNEYHKL